MTICQLECTSAKSNSASQRAGSCKGRMYKAGTHLVLQDCILEAADLVVLRVVVFHLEEKEKLFFSSFSSGMQIQTSSSQLMESQDPHYLFF